ncbi:MAG: 16S rRNA (guanine(966)-N(2))-methyltransferase RsmD [Pseudomonadota bacterium]
MSEVRIIGGLYRGRKLRFKAVAGLRPSLGRVRETLFNWLQGRIEGRRVLDLYCGSGALGVEALSRGAARVVFVDTSRTAVGTLRQNLRTLAVADSAAQVLQVHAEKYLQGSQASAEAPVDLLLLDPPFATPDLAIRSLALCLERRLLARDARVYFELPRRSSDTTIEALLALPVEILRDQTAGDCRFLLLELDPEDAANAAATPSID